jgi:hypothetical protein
MQRALCAVSLLTVVVLALGPGSAALAAGHDSPALKQSGCGDFKTCFEIGVLFAKATYWEIAEAGRPARRGPAYNQLCWNGSGKKYRLCDLASNRALNQP